MPNQNKDKAELDARTFLSTPDEWQFHRMTAQPLEVGKGSGELINSATLGLHLVEFPRPSTYAFASPGKPENDSRYSGFLRYSDKSVVAPDDEYVEQWLDAGRQVGDDIKENDHIPQFIRDAEWSVMKKLTVQKGRSLTAYITEYSGGQGVYPDRSFSHARDIVIARYKAYRGPTEYKPDPAFTNSGAPCFRPGPEGKLVSMLLFGNVPNMEAIIANIEAFSSRVGLPSGATTAYGMAYRSGPVYKDLPQLQFDGDSNWSEAFIAKGSQNRNRIVQMACAGGNRGVRRLYSALNSARRRIPGLWHPGGPAQEPLSRFRYHYEADISGYDRSVSSELMRFANDTMAVIAPDLQPEVRLSRFMEGRPMITPSWNLNSSMAAMIKYPGSIPSGYKLTSEIGTLINLIVILHGLEAAGLDISDWPHSRDFSLYVFGDDVRISTNIEIDDQIIAETYASVGLSAELVPGAVFLSRYTHPDLHDAPLAGRVIQQTMSNEKERLGWELVGLHYLGFMARSQGFDRWPAQLKKGVWDVIKHAKWIQRLNVNSVGNLRFRIMTNRTCQSEIRTALDSVAALDWYSDALRASEHSVAAAYSVQYALQARTNLGAKTFAAADVLEAIANKLGEQTNATRLSLAIEGYEAVSSSAKEAARWYKHAASIAGHPAGIDEHISNPQNLYDME